MAEILKGAPVAAAIDERTTALVRKARSRGIMPVLAILRVGNDEDAVSYEHSALKHCEKVGIGIKLVTLPEDVSQEELMLQMDKLNHNDSVHGVLMLRPLPGNLDEKAVCASLDPLKDVDGMTAASSAGVYSGSGDGFTPCTAQSCMEILNYYGIETAGKRVCVIGRSLVIGRPVSMLLLNADATVTICHTKTENLSEIVRSSDIVVAAAGSAESLTADYFSENQIVLDVGINWSETKIRFVGDVDYENVEPIVSAITPVPDGIGFVTTAVLAEHVAEAAFHKLTFLN